MLDQQKITILYCRLSNEDAQDGESNSIANQREYLTRYARDHGYTNLKILVVPVCRKVLNLSSRGLWAAGWSKTSADLVVTI